MRLCTAAEYLSKLQADLRVWFATRTQYTEKTMWHRRRGRYTTFYRAKVRLIADRIAVLDTKYSGTRRRVKAVRRLGPGDHVFAFVGEV